MRLYMCRHPCALALASVYLDGPHGVSLEGPLSCAQDGDKPATVVAFDALVTVLAHQAVDPSGSLPGAVCCACFHVSPCLQPTGQCHQ